MGRAPSLTGCPIGTKAGHTVPECKGLGMMGSEVSSIVNFFEMGNVCVCLWQCAAGGCKGKWGHRRVEYRVI